MIVDQIRHQCGDGICELSARVRSEAWAREQFTLWYRVPSDYAPDHHTEPPDASAFLTALLLWCLRRAEPLRIEGQVSARLLSSVPRIADICRAFWPDLMTPVDVVADPCEPATSTKLTGALFTRGVDSWYTALTHGRKPYDQGTLTHLVYVPSVDFMFDEAHRARCIADTMAAARAIGKVPVIAETNLRRHTERFLHWGYYHGAGLASVGHALGLERLLIPAARSYAHLEPDGSHTLLDPLWSTERTAIAHHGAEASRWEKVHFLSGAPLALETLKICFEANIDGNCGRCAKCLVTMVMMECAGAREACPFDARIDLWRVAQMNLPRGAIDQWRDEILPEVRDGRLALALRVLLLRSSSAAAAADARALTRSLRRTAERRFAALGGRPMRPAQK